MKVRIKLDKRQKQMAGISVNAMQPITPVVGIANHILETSKEFCISLLHANLVQQNIRKVEHNTKLKFTNLMLGALRLVIDAKKLCTNAYKMPVGAGMFLMKS
jgi:hypothetical protein